jgi:Methyltransferase FkbM domain
VSLVGGEIPAAARYRFQLTRTRIEAKRLDDVLSGRRLLLLPPFRVDTTRIAVIKLDVEGHEPAVLAGAAGTIRSQRPFVMIESGNRNRGVAEFFRGASYRYAEREGSRLVETERHTTAANGFWFPAEREAHYRGLGLF